MSIKDAVLVICLNFFKQYPGSEGDTRLLYLDLLFNNVLVIQQQCIVLGYRFSMSISGSDRFIVFGVETVVF